MEAVGRSAPSPENALSVREVFSTWWPLAASWLMMGLELPAVSAVMARLADPNVNLAAYGGVVFPLAVFIESPIIMLLAASTALSRDLDSYRRLRRFMIASAAILGLAHLIVVATPLYHVVVGRLLSVPEPVRGPARIGMAIVLPWTPAIAYRRFHQGLLIRFGRSRAVGVGTAIRLGTNAAVLAVGYLAGGLPGIVVGTAAVSLAVVAEAAYVGAVARNIVRGALAAAPAVRTPLTLRRLLSFYLPLAVSPLFTTLAWTLVSAAVSRMPRSLDSLAVWPVLNGLVFTLRSMGFAFNEVVVVALDRPSPRRALVRFTLLLVSAVTTALLLVTVTPLGRIWFSGVSGLEPALATLALQGLWFAIPNPAFAVLMSFYQGRLVHAHRTRDVTVAVILYVSVIAIVLSAGVRNGSVTGLFFGLWAILAGLTAQTIWLRARAGRIGDVFGAPPAAS